MTADASDLLINHHWPGNVRELENVITRASVLGTGDAIDADLLADWLIAATPHAGQVADSATTAALGVGTSLQTMERTLIEATLEHFDGHRARPPTRWGSACAHWPTNYEVTDTHHGRRPWPARRDNRRGNRQELPIIIRQLLPVAPRDKLGKDRSVKTTELQ